MDNDKYSEAIRRFMTDHNLNQEEMARRFGVSQPTLNGWLNATHGISQKNRLAIEHICGVVNEAAATSAAMMHRVPVFGMAAAAQIGASNMPIADYAKEHADDYTYFPEAKPGDFSLIVSGDSMTPWYPEGTRLLVRPHVRPRDGERVVAVLADGDVVFKVFVEGVSTYALVSVNPAGKTFVFDKLDFGAVRGVYRVVASYRNEDDLDAAMGAAGIRHYWEKVKEELK